MGTIIYNVLMTFGIGVFLFLYFANPITWYLCGAGTCGVLLLGFWAVKIGAVDAFFELLGAIISGSNS